MLTSLTYQPRSLRGVLLHQVNGKSHLGVGFTLRCLQRLSDPDLATQLCFWRNFQRPQQIGTELSHDVLNPARVPL